MLTIPELTADAIRSAHATIDPAFRDGPQYVHDGLSTRLGVPVIVKVETVNPIRAFKGRGTWLAVRALANDGEIGPDRAVICASAGNFGQGVAFAARALGIPSLVYAARHANRAKIARMRALGATVVEIGDDFDDARAAANPQPPAGLAGFSSMARIRTPQRAPRRSPSRSPTPSRPGSCPPPPSPRSRSATAP